MSIDGISVHAERVNPELTDICHASWSCDLAGLVADLWLLMVAGVFTLIVLSVLTNLRKGADVVEREQSRTAAERDAFYEFAARISELSPDSEGKIGGANGSAIGSPVALAHPPRSASKVREAYRETVMGVPHYDLDYGESLEDNMAIEFGEDVAAAIEDGQTLSPMLQQLLVSKARAAATEREQLIGQLEDEAEELNHARTTLSVIESELEGYEIPSRLDAIADRWDRLEELEDRCNDLVQRRQCSIVEGRIDGGMDTPSLVEYLYSSLTVDYPVLADTAAILEQIESARQALVSTAIRRA